MNELVFKTEKGTSVTNSLLIAEKFGKEHKHVLESIRELIRSAENSAQFYRSSSYMDSMNRTQEMFIMNRDGFSLLVMGFNGFKALQFKIEYIEAFNQMEAAIKEIALPKTFAEALQLAADQAKQIELQDSQIKELAPKAEIFQQIVNADNLLALNEVAKTIGIGRNTMMKILREKGILRGNNTPYQQAIDSGFFVVKIKPIKIGNSDSNYVQTYCTGKGLTWLTKMMKNSLMHLDDNY